MNGKPDEPFDQWIRQSLDRLPDAPPPGTRFDAGRLWDQLQPELQKAPAHRRTDPFWWAAAACLVSVLLGWLWMSQQPEPTRRTVGSVVRPNAPVPVRPEQRATARIDPSELVRPTNTHQSFRLSARRPARIASNSPAVVPPGEPDRPVATVTELPAIADTKLPVVTQPQTVSSTAVAVAPKRRFRVVHLNELLAEEEIRPALHRTDRFVRLGTGDHGQPAPETAHPTITWPLTNKPN